MESLPWRLGDAGSVAEDVGNTANSQAGSLIWSDGTHGLWGGRWKIIAKLDYYSCCGGSPATSGMAS